MAKTVVEIMNQELFFVSPGEAAEDLMSFLVNMKISGAPVLDNFGKPLGVVSLADLAGRGMGEKVEDFMSVPALCIGMESSIEEAGRRMAESKVHRLVVTDSEGRAVGIVSTLDVVRGLLALPTVHPLSHYDNATGLTWSNPFPLEMDRIEAAPTTRGVFVILQAEAGEKDQVVWSEGAPNLRARLIELIDRPEGRLPHDTNLHVRVAEVDGPVGMEQALAVLAKSDFSLSPAPN